MCLLFRNIHASRCFQPSWTILVKHDHFPTQYVEVNKKMFKPPPGYPLRCYWRWLSTRSGSFAQNLLGVREGLYDSWVLSTEYPRLLNKYKEVRDIDIDLYRLLLGYIFHIYTYVYIYNCISIIIYVLNTQLPVLSTCIQWTWIRIDLYLPTFQHQHWNRTWHRTSSALAAFGEIKTNGCNSPHFGIHIPYHHPQEDYAYSTYMNGVFLMVN